ncbi:MAG: hypothetical protein QOE86_1449 [Solirubrobacteraceae bacterium]|jgi:hypothetical protein|nr:hypothetical protein [Solirubrobacteraceae bacterium]
MLDERTTEQPPEPPTSPEERPNGQPPEATAPEAERSEGAPVEAEAVTAAEPAPPEAAGPAAEGSDVPAAAETPAATAAPEAAPVAAEPPADPPAAPLDAPAVTPAATAEPEAAAPTGEHPADTPAETPAEKPAAKARPQRPPAKRAPRPREPLPWPELRAAAGVAGEGIEVEDLKELFRLLPNDVRDETVDGVREYRKGARRPVSAFAGKSLARAVHTARRARRRPDSDDAVSEALGQALAAEIIASLDVEIAAEVILPKRDLLEREARNARRRQRDDDMRSRDERRRRAREQSNQGDHTQGTYSGAKIRGLDELKKLFEEQQPEADG